MDTSLSHLRPKVPGLLLATCLGLGLNGSAAADDGPWRLRLALDYVDVGGHDPQVLVVDDGGSRSHSLETESGLGYGLGLRHEGGEKWNWGGSFRWFTGAQELRVPNAAAGAGAGPVTFRMTEREFASNGPAEVLFFERLGDTDMNAWTFDLYALRRLSRSPNGGVWLLLGVRNADFDNDTHFVVGLEGVEGTRLDASSNYTRMIGPLVGLVLDHERGRSAFELTLALSVVGGDVELEATLFDFAGAFMDPEAMYTPQETFNDTKSVTIPIAGLGARWTYAMSDWIALGLGLDVSYWSDVSVPPGVRPGGRLDTLYESSITLMAPSALVEIDF
jgi:hypothetical protein